MGKYREEQRCVKTACAWTAPDFIADSEPIVVIIFISYSSLSLHIIFQKFFVFVFLKCTFKKKYFL